MVRTSTAAFFCAVSLFLPVQVSRDGPIAEQWKERARDADQRLRMLKTQIEASPKGSTKRTRLRHEALLEAAFAAHLSPEMADKVHRFNSSNGVEMFALDIYSEKDESLRIEYNYRGTKLVSAVLAHLPKNWSAFFKTGEETLMLIDDEQLHQVVLIDLREPFKSFGL